MVGTFFIILTVIETIFFIFHASVLYLLFRKRKTIFAGAFYKMFQIILFYDLISFFNMVVWKKLSLIPFFIDYFQNSTFLPSFIYNISGYMTVVQFFGHTLMAFNRFTSACFPFQYKKLWKKQWYTFSIIILPLLQICWRLQYPTKFKYLKNDIVSIAFENPEITSIGNLTATTFYTISTCFSAVFNILAFAKLNKKQFSSSININEKSLLYVSIVIFLTQLLRTLYPFGQICFPNNEKLLEFLFSIFPLLNDIFAWSGSITLLFLSSIARKAYLSFYFGQKIVQISGTT